MRTILSALLLLLPLAGFAQKQTAIWYFGDHAGLDFNSGSPVALTNGATYNDALPHSEGTSVICDSAGSLLFYTNGQSIWNRNHSIMPNGGGLLGHLSSTQAALTVAQPGSSRFFYVFTTDAFLNSLNNGLRYSVVDICLDNGRGDVVSGKKNILLLDTVAEKLTAVRHSNGVDYWIITHKFNSDAFYAWQLSASGIVDTVISNVGSEHKEYCSSSTSPTRSAIGALKASPDGSRLACVNGQTCNKISELFDFNKTSGAVSNPIQLLTDSIAVGFYGVAFSPDNSKLYISSQINRDRVYQYDLSSGVAATIVNSKVVVRSVGGGPYYGALQLAPDGKIYVALRNRKFLAAINSPNLAGSSCNFSDSAISLNGKLCSYGLPNFMALSDYANAKGPCETTGIGKAPEQSIAKLYPNPFSDQLHLEVAGQRRNIVSLRDVLGRPVLQQTFVNTGTCDTRGLPGGIYFYRVLDEHGVLLGQGKIRKY